MRSRLLEAYYYRRFYLNASSIDAIMIIITVLLPVYYRDSLEILVFMDMMEFLEYQ